MENYQYDKLMKKLDEIIVLLIEGKNDFQFSIVQAIAKEYSDGGLCTCGTAGNAPCPLHITGTSIENRSISK